MAPRGIVPVVQNAILDRDDFGGCHRQAFDLRRPLDLDEERRLHDWLVESLADDLRGLERPREWTGDDGVEGLPAQPLRNGPSLLPPAL